MSETASLTDQEYHEKAKYYLEGALKILGIGQIAAGATDMFWNGFNFNIFNISIVVTGVIFFIGAETLRATLNKIIKKEEKEREKKVYDSYKRIDDQFTATFEEYKEKTKEKEHKLYSFAEKEEEND